MKRAKKLMLLGGLRYLIPIIKTAHKLGVYVITVDYIPENIAHKYSDEYHNVSILDKEAVLNLAKSLEIDGIMSFAVDPGVLTAAYVAEQLNLPFQGSYRSVEILQNKDLFRKFLKDNKFNVPEAKGFEKLEEALEDKNNWNYPVIVKPVDSAGSKGVTKVNKPDELEPAILTALNESHSHKFIIEEFIEPLGETSDSDSFTVNGELKVCTFSDQYFDKNALNPFTPAAYSWPSTMDIKFREELRNEIRRLMTLLDMKTGIYNIETRVGKNRKTYIMEVSPRGGGNRLAEMVDIAAGTDLIENSVRAALNIPLKEIKSPVYNDYLIEIILHSDKGGIYEAIEIKENLKPFLIETNIWVNKGDKVNSFNGANNALGTLVFKTYNEADYKVILSEMHNCYKIILQ